MTPGEREELLALRSEVEGLRARVSMVETIQRTLADNEAIRNEDIRQTAALLRTLAAKFELMLEGRTTT